LADFIYQSIEEEIKMKRIILIFAMVMLFPMVANANGDEDYKKYFYVGGGLGFTAFSADQDFENFYDSDIGDEALAAKVYGGYRFHKHMGIELGLHYFGEIEFEEDHKGDDFDSTAKGMSLSLLWHAPVTERIGVFLRTGMLYSGLTGDNIDDMDGISFILGLGASIDLGNNFFISPEIEWSPNVLRVSDEGEVTTTFYGYDYDDEGYEQLVGTVSFMDKAPTHTIDVLSTTLTIGWRFF